MRRIAKYILFGIVGLCILGAIVNALGGGNREAAGTTAQPAAQAVADATAVIAPTPADAATVEAAPAAEAPAPTPDPTTAPEPTIPPEPTPAPTVAASYAVGQDVQVGEVRWKILEAKDEGQQLASTNEFIEPKPTQGKWIRVRLEIENLSTSQLNFTGVDLTDSQGRTFQVSSDAIMHIPTEESCGLAQLNANLPKTCQVVYEVPADASDLKVKVGDLKLFGGEEALIALGL